MLAAFRSIRLLKYPAAFRTRSTMAMLPPLPGVSIRRGRAEDLPSVTRLSKAVNYMDGGDYLPGVWLHMLSDPHWHVYVAVKEGEVVSTTCMRVVRGGLQGAGVGGKTHPSVRGERIFEALRTYATISLVAEFPHIKSISGITPFIELTLGRKGTNAFWNFEDKARRHQWWVKTTLEDITTASNRLQTMQVAKARQINEEELKAVLRNNHLRQSLFAGNQIQMGPEMYEAHEDVSEAICKSYRQVFMGQENSSLSIAATFACPLGTALHLDCYGTGEIDVVLQHVLEGFRQLPEQHKKHGGGVFIMLGFPIKTDMKKLLDVMWNQLGLPKQDNNVQEVMLQSFNVNLMSQAANL